MTPADLPATYAGPPLRIAYVGNFRHTWCTERHVSDSLAMIGHTVICWQEDELDWSRVPSKVREFQANVLMWTRTWPAEMAVVEPVLKELAAEGIPTISYHLDRWFGLDRQHQVDDQPFFRTSLVVSPDDSPQWAEHGVNHFWLPPGVYGPECEPVPPNPRRWPWDVVFVGSHPYPHPEWQKYRTDLLSAFRAAFGRRFAILPRERRGTPIRGRDLQELYATVPVVLGDSCLAGESFSYISDRVTETLGRGGFFIHPFVEGMIGFGPDDWYLASKDLMGYQLGDYAEAVVRARWALDHPEEAREIAEHGRATVLARDTYAHRMGTVLAVAEGIYGGYRDDPLVSRRRDKLRHDPAYQERIQRVRADAAHGIMPPLIMDLPSVPSLRVKLNRWSAVFEPRPDTTDAEVIAEVWTSNDYRVPPEGFKGTVVDIGANVGAFSVLAKKAGASQVVAVEPEVGNRERLHRHLGLNGVAVKAMPWAVTDGATEFVRMDGSGGAARSVADADDEEVPTVTLAMLLGMIDGPVEFLKMDIEGGEYGAFAACPAEALAAVERIALELHGPGMPHLTHLNADGKHIERWGALVAKLADAGRVELFGHPMRGGLCWWTRY